MWRQRRGGEAESHAHVSPGVRGTEWCILEKVYCHGAGRRCLVGNCLCFQNFGKKQKGVNVWDESEWVVPERGAGIASLKKKKIPPPQRDEWDDTSKTIPQERDCRRRLVRGWLRRMLSRESRHRAPTHSLPAPLSLLPALDHSPEKHEADWRGGRRDQHPCRGATGLMANRQCSSDPNVYKCGGCSFFFFFNIKKNWNIIAL